MTNHYAIAARALENLGVLARRLQPVRMATWTKYEGPRGGNGWRNTATGDVLYQDEMPGDETGGHSDSGKAVAKPGWRDHRLKAREYAVNLGIGEKVKGASHEQTVKAIDDHLSGGGKRAGGDGASLQPTRDKPATITLRGNDALQVAFDKGSWFFRRPGKGIESRFSDKSAGWVFAGGATRELILNTLAASQPKPEKQPVKQRTGPAIVHIDDISVDAPRFQYKIEGIGAGGVTQQFSDVDFNPELAGMLYVWHDPESDKTFVVNGHHRYQLAKRSGWKGELPVRFIDRKTATEARAFGALINIAEGAGTALDAAKFMRDTGMTGIEGLAYFKENHVSIKGQVAADSLKLANLSDKVFSELTYGRIPIGFAKAIGEELAPGAGSSQATKDAVFEAQNKLLGRIQKSKSRLSESVVREMALNASLAPKVAKGGGPQKSLFGDDEEEEILFEDRGRIQAAVRDSLTKDVRGFGAVSSAGREDLLRSAGVGDVDAQAASAKKSESEVIREMYDREIRFRGETGDKINSILNNAAKELHDATTKQDRSRAAKEAIARVRRLLAEAAKAEQATVATVGERSQADRATGPWIAAGLRTGGRRRVTPLIAMSKWVRYKGPRGGQGWKSGNTIVYQDEMPSGKPEKSDQPTTNRQQTDNKPANQSRRLPNGLITPPGDFSTHFTGVSIDKQSQERILKAVGGIPDGWSIKADHVTLHGGEAAEGEHGPQKMIATAVAKNDRVMAVMLKGGKHLTIAVAPGANPRESLDLKGFKRLKQPVVLSGEIKTDQRTEIKDKAAAKAAAKAKALEATKHLADHQLIGALAKKDDPELYFNTENAVLFPVSKLTNIRARPEGIANAARFMYAAALGQMPKRGPVSVMKTAKGYEIFDGNSTFNIAKQAGWKNLPVQLVDKDGTPIESRLDVARSKNPKGHKSRIVKRGIPKEARPKRNENGEIFGYHPVTHWPNGEPLAYGEAPDWLLEHPITTTEKEQYGSKLKAIEARKRKGRPPIILPDGIAMSTNTKKPTLRPNDLERAVSALEKLSKLQLSRYPIKMEAGRAPAGGVNINGEFYVGGQFIPGTTQEEVDNVIRKQLGDDGGAGDRGGVRSGQHPGGEATRQPRRESEGGTGGGSGKLPASSGQRRVEPGIRSGGEPGRSAGDSDGTGDGSTVQRGSGLTKPTKAAPATIKLRGTDTLEVAYDSRTDSWFFHRPKQGIAAKFSPKDKSWVYAGGATRQMIVDQLVADQEAAHPKQPAVQDAVSKRPTRQTPTDCSAGNYRYQTRDFAKGGLKQKFNQNIAALKTLQTMRVEGRTKATAEEQETISKFVGWGAFPALFNENWAGDRESREREAAQRDIDPNFIADKWKSEREILRTVLSADEFQSAKGSILNAHFTAPAVVDAHWKMAQKLGFNGGRFLETSAGIGYYLGLMPPELAKKTHTSAVELDQTTGNMLKAMYPATNVQVTGFEKLAAPDNFYDLVASNVPFGNYGIHDPKYNKHNALIHDYFFLKSADLAAPGGLIMHITSTGTMDKPDSKIRKELMKTCDIVGAVRFPGGAHQENAGTAVVTDMIILRKRHPGEEPVSAETPSEAEPKGPGFTGITTDSLGRLYHWKDGVRVPGPKWDDVVDVPDPDGGDPIQVNRYFADNPQHILGRLDRSGTMYHAGNDNVSLVGPEDLSSALGRSVVVHVTDDGKRRFVFEDDGSLVPAATIREVGMPLYEKKLDEFIESLPSGAFAPNRGSKTAFEPDVMPAPGDVKEGGYKIQDGKLYQRRGGALIEQKVNSKQLARIAGQLPILDATRGVINSQIGDGGEQSRDAARAKLNEVYDAYVAEHGYLHERENWRAMRDAGDDFHLLQSLEKWNAAEGKATKRDIFSKDTIRRETTFDHADSVADGFTISLHEKAGVDVDYIAELTGKSVEEVAMGLSDAGIAFEDPETGWTAADIYLSGNVRKKLMMAQAAAAADPRYQINVDALLKVQPEDKDYTEIGAKLGAVWIPPSDVAAFAAHLVGTRQDPSELFDVFHAPGVGWQARWTSKGARLYRDSAAATDTWGTSDRNVMVLLEAALTGTQVEIKGGMDERIEDDGTVVEFPAVGVDRNGDPVNITNRKATEDAAAKIQEIKDEFKDWIWDDDERTERLARYYNDNFNNIRDIDYDGSHLTFPGMNPAIKLHPHIKDFVWQVVNNGTALAGHEVGTGKAQPLDAKILTPSGWVMMGDVSVGDEVIAGDGTRTIVEAVFPQGNKEIFRVAFSDGSATECCDEHLWLTSTYRERNQAINARRAGKTRKCATPKVRSLKEIRESLTSPHLNAKNHSIPMIGAAELFASPVPIEPYLLGTLLGDGSISQRHARITSSDMEGIDHASAVVSSDLMVRRVKTTNRCPSWSIVRRAQKGFGADKEANPIVTSLSELGLLGCRAYDKFVPDEYKFNSVEARHAVLQGLLDTDGTASERDNSISLSTSSPRLADDIVFLVQSLGGTVSRGTKIPTYTYKGEKRQGRLAHVLCVNLPNDFAPFRFPRKSCLLKPKTKYKPIRYIVAVEPIGKKPAQCIRVAHPSHLYVTDDFIVTHNTYAMIAAAMELRRLGLAKKPAITCLKSNIDQITADVHELYPGAKVLSTADMFDAKKRKQTLAQIATGDYDLIVMTHDHINKLNMKPEVEAAYIREEIQELENAKRTAEAEGGKKNNRAVKALETAKKNLEKRLQEALDKKYSDTAVYFEETGIDQLFVDECFPGETVVQTDAGPMTISDIVNHRRNVSVLSCDRNSHTLTYMPISSWFKRPLRNHLIKVRHDYGEFICTPNHNIWTEEAGYVQAGLLQSHHRLRIVPSRVPSELGSREGWEGQVLQPSMRGQGAVDANHEAVRTLRSGVHSTGEERRWPKPLLFQGVRSEMVLVGSVEERESIGGDSKGGHRGNATSFFGENEAEQSDDRPGCQGENAAVNAWKDILSEGRKRSDDEAAKLTGVRSLLANGAQHRNIAGEGTVYEPSELVHGRHCKSDSHDCCRGRRPEPQDKEVEVSGQEEDGGAVFSRVVSVAIHQRAGHERTFDGCSGSAFVYDLEVAGTHNYFADGVNVSNSHTFKTLPVYTKLQRVKGIPTGRSDRATNMLMRTRWLREQNGGRGVVFASGTPIDNTMAELYNNQRYLQPEQLKERGINSFDDWANTFGEITTRHEFSVAGEYKPTTRFSTFTNVGNLMNITRQMLDVQRADDLTRTLPDGTVEQVIKRPKRHDVAVVSPKSQAIEDLMTSLAARAEAIKRRRGPAQKGDDNMLVICTDGRKGALDMRLLDDTAPDDPNSKTNKCVDQVLKLHKARPDQAQIIFSDLGVNPQKNATTKDESVTDNNEQDSANLGSAGKFRLYDDIINKLVAGGIPRDQIADFSTLEGAKKQDAMARIRRGEIKVAIGSTKKLGTGTNVQTKIMAMHHLDVPWTPASVEQRDGRGWRHGNENWDHPEGIKVHRYITEGSLDQKFWSIISTKARFTKQIMTSQDRNLNEIEEEDTEVLSPEHLMAIASGDSRVMKKIEIEDSVKKLRSAGSRHRRQQQKFKKAVSNHSKAQEERTKEITHYKQDAEKLAEVPDFKLALGDVSYDKRPEAAEALAARVARIDQRYESQHYMDETVGQYRGMKLKRKKSYLQAPYYTLVGSSGEEYTTGDSLQSIEYVARNLDKKRQDLEDEMKRADQDIATVKAKMGKPFKDENQLAKLESELREIEDDLTGKTARKKAREAAAAVETLAMGLRADPVTVHRLPRRAYAVVATAFERLLGATKMSLDRQIRMATWTKYAGPRGGNGWKNAAGDVVYQDEMPGDDGGGFTLTNKSVRKAPKIEGFGKAKQGSLFQKSGLPGQKQLFADVGVPDDLVGGSKPKLTGPANRLKVDTEKKALQEGVDVSHVGDDEWEFMSRQGLVSGQALRNILMGSIKPKSQKLGLDPRSCRTLARVFERLIPPIQMALDNRITMAVKATWAPFPTKSGKTGAYNAATGKKLYGDDAAKALAQKKQAAPDQQKGRRGPAKPDDKKGRRGAKPEETKAKFASIAEAEKDVRQNIPAFAKEHGQTVPELAKSMGFADEEQMIKTSAAAKMAGFESVKEASAAKQVPIGPELSKALGVGQKDATGKVSAPEEPVKKPFVETPEQVAKQSQLKVNELPRIDMPQLYDQAKIEFLDKLRKKGVKVVDRDIPAEKLTGLQADYLPGKVHGIAGAMSQGATIGGGRALVTSDGYVIDGHHRWRASYQADKPVECTVIDMPAHQLIDQMHRYEKAERRTVNEVLVSKQTGFGNKMANYLHGKLDAVMQKAFKPSDYRLPVDKVQPFQSEDEVIEVAKQNEEDYHRILNMGLGVSKDLGATAVDARVDGAFMDLLNKVDAGQLDGPFVLIAPLKTASEKGLKRAREKVEKNYKGDWGRLKDVVRGTIAVDKYDDIPAAVNALREHVHSRGWTLSMRPESRFASPTPAGYRDIQLFIESPDGMQCEVQVNTKAMWVAKEKYGHKMYEEARSLSGDTPEERSRIDELDKQMAELYTKAWDASKGSNFD